MVFDSHAHYDDEVFNDDRDDLLKSLECYIINAGTDIKTSVLSIELAKKYENVYVAVGVHPHEASKNEDITKIEELAKCDKVVAIGEIGLDYHYNFSPKEIQIDYFVEQLKLADRINLPIIVHDRESHQDILRLLKENPVKRTGVIHCFSGSAQMAEELLSMGYYLGFGGAITFTNAKKNIEVLGITPIDKILIETDCPYMTPRPFRGKRNDSSYLSYVIEKISEVKGLSIEEVENITFENAKRAFGI